MCFLRQLIYVVHNGNVGVLPLTHSTIRVYVLKLRTPPGPFLTCGVVFKKSTPSHLASSNVSERSGIFIDLSVNLSDFSNTKQVLTLQQLKNSSYMVINFIEVFWI